MNVSWEQKETISNYAEKYLTLWFLNDSLSKRKWGNLLVDAEKCPIPTHNIYRCLTFWNTSVGKTILQLFFFLLKFREYKIYFSQLTKNPYSLFPNLIKRNITSIKENHNLLPRSLWTPSIYHHFIFSSPSCYTTKTKHTLPLLLHLCSEIWTTTALHTDFISIERWYEPVVQMSNLDRHWSNMEQLTYET